MIINCAVGNCTIYEGGERPFIINMNRNRTVDSSQEDVMDYLLGKPTETTCSVVFV